MVPGPDLGARATARRRAASSASTKENQGRTPTTATSLAARLVGGGRRDLAGRGHRGRRGDRVATGRPGAERRRGRDLRRRAGVAGRGVAGLRAGGRAGREGTAGGDRRV